MKKITLLIAVLLLAISSNAQVVLVQETFQDWTSQISASSYTITKKLFDGVTNGIFTGDILVVTPTQSIGSAGSATGNGSPSIGRAVLSGVGAYIQLPELPSIGVVNIKASAGTDLNAFKLQTLVGSTWTDIPLSVTQCSKTITKLFTFNYTYSSATSMRIATNQNGSVNIWDIQVYSYVSSLTKLATPTNGIGNTATSSGFTATWTQVANATSYLVKAYLGPNLFSSTSSATGTSSVVVTGLLSGLEYTYKVIAVGNGTTNIDSDPSIASIAISTTDPNAVNSLNANFTDASWGTALTTLPATTLFGTTSLNGFTFSNAALYTTGSTKDSKGNSHTNRISLDAASVPGSIFLPTVNSVGQIEIHGSMGTAPNYFLVKEFDPTTNSWKAVGGNYVYEATSKAASTDSIYIIPISRSVPTKFRIDNGVSGSCNIWQVITRTNNPTTLTSPTVGTASSITANTITAQWTPADGNASNFEVRVYKVITNATTGVKTVTTTLKTSALSINGSASISVNITGLQADSTYIFKVKAFGDGDVNYLDSYLSVPSAQFTMSHQLAAPTIGLVSGIGSTGFTANWTAVANAVGYTVNVYDATPALVKSVSVSGQTANSGGITGLTSETAYTYKVVAIGDNTTYFNSIESASTPATTDTATGLSDELTSNTLIVSGKSIITSETGLLQVYNLQGAQLLQVQNTNKVNTNLATGLYVVRFTNNFGKQIIRKFAIK